VPAPRFLTAFAAAVVAACFFAGCSPESRAARSGPTVKPVAERKPAPEFALKDADGKTVHLEEYKGKVVLLDFFATWCSPCKIEIPWFMEMERANKDKGVQRAWGFHGR